jgi:hypothetical protein
VSDKNKKVECRIHGTSHATFVCQHLPKGQGRGFFCADDSDDPQPDAWCAECEKVRLAAGEWNDTSEKFARITLLCAGCYEVVKRRNQPPQGFFCGKCGQFHAELPMDFGADAPVAYYSIPQQQREARCKLTSDLCIIDEQEFFVRGCLEIPVVDGPRPFVWGVWTSLSKQSFKRMTELWESPGREAEPPFFGWLCTSLPLYQRTLLLKTNVHSRPVGKRPFVELQPTDHPLAVEQRQGITMDRVRAIAEALLHGSRDRQTDEPIR